MSLAAFLMLFEPLYVEAANFPHQPLRIYNAHLRE